MTATLLAGDGIAAQIAGGSWTSGAATSGGGASPCSSIPGFPGPLSHLVQPLEDLLDMFTGEPAAVYQASREWEQTTGDVADVGARMKALAGQVDAQLQGATAEALEEVLRTLAQGANSVRAAAVPCSRSVAVFAMLARMAPRALPNVFPAAAIDVPATPKASLGMAASSEVDAEVRALAASRASFSIVVSSSLVWTIFASPAIGPPWSSCRSASSFGWVRSDHSREV